MSTMNRRKPNNEQATTAMELHTNFHANSLFQLFSCLNCRLYCFSGFCVISFSFFKNFYPATWKFSTEFLRFQCLEVSSYVSITLLARLLALCCPQCWHIMEKTKPKKFFVQALTTTSPLMRRHSHIDISTCLPTWKLTTCTSLRMYVLLAPQVALSAQLKCRVLLSVQ